MKTRKNVALWILYDFANSIVSIVFFLYFGQWIVVERGVSDIYYNITFTIAALLLLCSAPLLGSLLTRIVRRITCLWYSTSATALLYAACTFCAVYNLDVIALIFFCLGLYSYLLSFTFYTPLLTDISSPEKRGFVSGLGMTGNYLGQIVGLVIVLPFSNSTVSLFNASPRVETLFPAILIFILLTIPMLLWFKEPFQKYSSFALKHELKILFSETKSIFLFPGVALFLFAYFLFNDAVLTASNNFPIFLEQVWHVSDTAKTHILLGILFTSAIGAFASGVIADRFGHKRTLLAITFGWIFILPLMGLATNFTFFVAMTTFMGLWFGSNWSVSRSLMSHVAPPNKHNLVFAYFGLVERASSLIGPLMWGGTIAYFAESGSDKYRFAVLAVTIFIVIGFFVLRKVRSDRTV